MKRTKFPPELEKIAKMLPKLKLKLVQRGCSVVVRSWSGTIKISEKRAREQDNFARAWDRVHSLLKKKPWMLANSERSGYDGQYDVGGNLSKKKSFHVHASGLHVGLYYSTSFVTGTKIWTVTAWYE